MFDSYETPKIKDALKAITTLKKIERPDGDNEGDSINSQSIYDSLSDENLKTVNENVEILYDYVRKPDGSPNIKGINAIRRHGHDIHLNLDQYDPDRLVGTLEISVKKDNEEGWSVDLSEPSIEDDNEYE